jgi:hypothetical protein
MLAPLRHCSKTLFGTTRAFSTTARLLALPPPEDLDERELHVFQKLDKELEPSRLTVPSPFLQLNPRSCQRTC